MRHRVKGRHLGRTAEHRRALERNLVAALLEHGRIRTTDAKAREVRPLAERMITLGKRGDLHARRQAVRVLGNGVALERLFGTIAERFAERPGGYTRLIKAGRRLGDAAPLAYLELLDEAPRVVQARGTDEREREREGAHADTAGSEPARRGGIRGALQRRVRAAREGTEAGRGGATRSRRREAASTPPESEQGGKARRSARGRKKGKEEA